MNTSPETSKKKAPRFTRIAEKASSIAGSPIAFMGALTLVLAWGLSGHYFDYSETWQMVLKTITTIITFLLVFLIQNSQNRATKAVQIKLNELIRATVGAQNGLLNVEKLTEKELDEIIKNYTNIAKKPVEDESQ